MVTKKLFNSREEWLQGRKNHIGGSDAAACVGLNPYKDNVQLWEEKVGLVLPEDISDINNIDGQIKGYEERLREEKTAKVREFYEDNIHDIGKYLPFERVMQPRYALASTTMKSIKEEILALIQKVDEGLAVLNEVDSPYAGDMKKAMEASLSRRITPCSMTGKLMLP